jgi:hypothetical protein
LKWGVFATEATFEDDEDNETGARDLGIEGFWVAADIDAPGVTACGTNDKAWSTPKGNHFGGPLTSQRGDNPNEPSNLSGFALGSFARGPSNYTDNDPKNGTPIKGSTPQGGWAIGRSAPALTPRRGAATRHRGFSAEGFATRTVLAEARLVAAPLPTPYAPCRFGTGIIALPPPARGRAGVGVGTVVQPDQIML